MNSRKIYSTEHRPEAISGWVADETTIWAATVAAPPFTLWPEGYGEVAGYSCFKLTAHNGLHRQPSMKMGLTKFLFSYKIAFMKNYQC